VTTIPHPYKGKIEYHEARISCDISKEDYFYLFREILPLRNSTNVVLATLFHKLITELRTNHANELIPYDVDNERIVHQCLQRLTFVKHNDTGSVAPNRRRAKTVRSQNSRTPNKPTIAKSKG
jgi:hypothetical protein